MSLPPPAHDETTVEPPAVNRPATTITYEEIDSEEIATVVDMMAIIDKIIDSIVNQIPISVEPTDDTAASEGKTLPQHSTTAGNDAYARQDNISGKTTVGAAVASMVLADQQYEQVLTDFRAKKKRYTRQGRLNLFEQELLKI